MNENQKVKVFESKEAAGKAVGESLIKELELNKNKAILLMLSGGSWIKATDSMETDNINLKGMNLTVLPTDERYSTDPTINNIMQLKETGWVKKLVENGAKIIETVPNANESLAEFGDRINGEIKQWIEKNPEGKIMAAVGMGGMDNTAGHLAGIEPMPDEEEKFKKLFVETEKFYVGYRAKSLVPTERATMTFKLLEKATVIALITGEEKKGEALRKALVSENPAEIPAAFLRKEGVEVFTDFPVE